MAAGRLPAKVHDRAVRSALRIMRTSVALTNTSLRRECGLNYDEAVRFFREAVAAGFLERRGTGPRTHYVKAGP